MFFKHHAHKMITKNVCKSLGKQLQKKSCERGQNRTIEFHLLSFSDFFSSLVFAFIQVASTTVTIHYCVVSCHTSHMNNFSIYQTKNAIKWNSIPSVFLPYYFWAIAMNVDAEFHSHPLAATPFSWLLLSFVRFFLGPKSV